MLHFIYFKVTCFALPLTLVTFGAKKLKKKTFFVNSSPVCSITIFSLSRQ